MLVLAEGLDFYAEISIAALPTHRHMQLLANLMVALN